MLLSCKKFGAALFFTFVSLLILASNFNGCSKSDTSKNEDKLSDTVIVGEPDWPEAPPDWEGDWPPLPDGPPLSEEVREDSLLVIPDRPTDILDNYPIFPWPPPRASAYMVLSKSSLIRSDRTYTLGQIKRLVTAVLDSCGYDQIGYYVAGPSSNLLDGFAIVTQVEKISASGKPLSGSERWEVVATMNIDSFERDWDLKKFLSELFTANPGNYRALAFLVTPHPFVSADTNLSYSEAQGLVQNATQKLPSSILDITYTNEYECTVLIYEFIQPESKKQKVLLKLPSELTGKIHLQKAGILAMIEKERL